MERIFGAMAAVLSAKLYVLWAHMWSCVALSVVRGLELARLNLTLSLSLSLVCSLSPFKFLFHFNIQKAYLSPCFTDFSTSLPTTHSFYELGTKRKSSVWKLRTKEWTWFHWLSQLVDNSLNIHWRQLCTTLPCSSSFPLELFLREFSLKMSQLSWQIITKNLFSRNHSCFDRKRLDYIWLCLRGKDWVFDSGDHYPIRTITRLTKLGIFTFCVIMILTSETLLWWRLHVQMKIEKNWENL